MLRKLREQWWYMLLWLPLATALGLGAVWLWVIFHIIGAWTIQYYAAPKWGFCSAGALALFVLFLVLLFPRKPTRGIKITAASIGLVALVLLILFSPTRWLSITRSVMSMAVHSKAFRFMSPTTPMESPSPGFRGRRFSAQIRRAKLLFVFSRAKNVMRTSMIGLANLPDIIQTIPTTTHSLRPQETKNKRMAVPLANTASSNTATGSNSKTGFLPFPSGAWSPR